MSDFLKFAFELIAQIVYYLSSWVANFFTGFVKLFITGWADYISIFRTYFTHFGFVQKVLSILLILILIAIPVVIIILIVKRIILRIQLKTDKADNHTLYREIGRLNKQVLELMEEKNKILALKVNNRGAAGTPYIGADGLDVGSGAGLTTGVGTPETGIGIASGAAGAASLSVGGIGEEALTSAAAAAATAAAKAKKQAEESDMASASRFPKLTLVDEKYRSWVQPDYNYEISLEQFVENYRRFAASQLKLYYTPEIIRRFVAGMAASRILILEGISGTGKTSLPYSFSRYLNNPSTFISVQPSFRDRTELLGYFNEFSKRFNETEFLRALYEAGYRQDPSFIVLDEMNLARIEYYFAEMLSILEMPSVDEWNIDLVPTAWPGDPVMLNSGKIHISPSTWFVGTANNDDSTYTITDKVYDRAIPIELNERADAFECSAEPSCWVTYEYLSTLFQKAKVEHPISQDSLDKLNKLDKYLQTRFRLSFGNRITKQMFDFVPVYVACGGKEVGGMDYIIARKVLKKFESMNIMFVRDEIQGLMEYIDTLFGAGEMPDSFEYLKRVKNLI